MTEQKIMRSWGVWLLPRDDFEGGWLRNTDGKYFYYFAPGPAIALAKDSGWPAEAREFPLEEW